MKTFRTIGTGNEQTISEIETDKIPLYPSEQDLLDDLENLEVGQIVGVIDPAESELIGTLIQRIQALESKLESDDVYSTDEVMTNKKWIDGKPIYRKTFYSATNFGGQASQTIGSVAGYETIVRIFSVQPYGNAPGIGYRQNWGAEGGTGGWTEVLYNGDVVYYSPNWSSSTKPAHVTIEYTKTTD